MTSPSALTTFQTEPWGAVVREGLVLGQRHWEEITVDKDIPLDMDLAAYAAMEATGQLHVTTVRAAGTMIGYSVVIVRPHLHYRTLLCGYFDLYWLEPTCRGGFAWTGLKMFREVERALAARGVKKLFTGTKRAHDASAIFKRLGWSESERLWIKRIGD